MFYEVVEEKCIRFAENRKARIFTPQHHCLEDNESLNSDCHHGRERCRLSIICSRR